MDDELTLEQKREIELFLFKECLRRHEMKIKQREMIENELRSLGVTHITIHFSK